MNLSKEVLTILQNAVTYAKHNKLEYVTPEVVLLMLLAEPYFLIGFEECGGDIQLLEDDLKQYIKDYIEKVDQPKPELSAGTNEMLNLAGQSAYNSSSEEICIRHLVHGMWNLENSYAVYFMEQQNITERELLQELANLDDMEAMGTEEITHNETDSSEEKLSLYAPCLNDTLKDVNPLIGRSLELERTIQILCRKDKNNPLHIGEPGVGKTAITYGLVELLKENNVPEPLQGAKVFALDLGSMLAGTQYRGDFEKRLKRFWLLSAKRTSLLFILTRSTTWQAQVL